MDTFILPHEHSSPDAADELREHLNKTENFQLLADIFKLLADSSRVRIFWLLCHCEECVVNIATMVDMSSPAASHHLRQLKDAGLIVSRRVGKEVYYRAAQSEQAKLLHLMIEKTMAISCPEEVNALESVPSIDRYHGREAEKYSAEQIETVRCVHELLINKLNKRYTIDELSKAFLINPSDLKKIFKAVYGNSIASHINDHRMERASELLLNTDMSISSIAAEVGFESHSKFSAQFKKTYDLLPAEYRKSNKK